MFRRYFAPYAGKASFSPVRRSRRCGFTETPFEQIPRGKRALSLFLTFFKIGCFTFGGGWSIVAQIQKEYIDKKHWLTEEQLLDFTSVGRSLPGIMITNISVFFGYQIAGALGSFAAVLGLIGSPFLIMIAVVKLYDLIKDNVYIANVMTGVRAAVVPIILCSIFKLFKPAMKDKPCYAFALAAFGLSMFTGLSNAIIVLIGAAAGIILTEVRTRHDLH